ncbi:MAG TPA: polynucleotide adenylyltransferase PcnB [Polyangia bacterium]|nr:polynucleotide adenylyltransferase PcnB [Polyangia bacterium]
MQIAPDQIDPDAAKVVQRLRDNEHLAYLVGGCVRDLLLGLKPKDFDVVTSATPNEIKRVFRNCRIIGRRFRLAHIFFGPKIIETATFRANPRELEDDDAGGGDAESGDLLIRRDNVFGTPEEDARRRDFTINGLFYDTKAGEVIDHVNGMVDLEARIVRTIGDPDIRFREDPIRILRAVKFAARCNLTIEPETYRRMMEHRGEIAKSAQARVSEEFYRLLRAGAAKRSMELLVETDLLQVFAPELARALRDGSEAPEGVDADEAARRRARLWAYLGALDRSTERGSTPPTNALILAVLLLPPLRDALDPDSNGVRDIGHLVARSSAPALERLKPSRRDSELSRQILLAIRDLLPAKHPRRKQRHISSEFRAEAMRLCQIIADAETADPTLAGRPFVVEGAEAAAAELAQDAEDAAAELDGGADGSVMGSDGRRRRRRGRRGQGRPGEAMAGAGTSGASLSDVRPSAPTHARTHVVAPAPVVPVDLNGLLAVTRSLATPPTRPEFLGGGGFGGPWSSRVE